MLKALLHLQVHCINRPCSYNNGGSLPTLLWQLTVACMKMNRPEIAAEAVSVAEKRISRDKWPEYYDTEKARFIGEQSQLYQTWSIAGYLVAKLLLKDPDVAKILTTEEDHELINAFSCMITGNPRRKHGLKSSKQFRCRISEFVVEMKYESRFSK